MSTQKLFVIYRATPKNWHLVNTNSDGIVFLRVADRTDAIKAIEERYKSEHQTLTLIERVLIASGMGSYRDIDQWMEEVLGSVGEDGKFHALEPSEDEVEIERPRFVIPDYKVDS